MMAVSEKSTQVWGQSWNATFFIEYNFLFLEWVWAVKLCKTTERETGGFYKRLSSSHERGRGGKYNFSSLWFWSIKLKSVILILQNNT